MDKTYILIFIFLILLSCLIVFINLKRLKRIKVLKSLLDNVNKALENIKILMDDEHYMNRKKYTKWFDEFSHIKDKINFDLDKLKLPDALTQPFEKYFEFIKSNERLISNYNDQIVEKTKKLNENFFDVIESYPLDSQQRDCICHEEDAVLVLAGAGTGKTSTIIGKVAYLINKCNVNPNEILLLSFTKKSSEELEERVNRVTNKKMNVYTFHKLGYEFISTVLNEKKDIAFTNDIELFNFIQNQFYTNLLDENYLNLARKFFHDFPSYTQFISVKRNHKKHLIGYDETVYKSIQEVMIANYLFSNQIRYEYERGYEVSVGNRNYRQYKPDFYLTDYGIYIELFGIDRNGNPPDKYTNIQKESYLKGIEWKRETHKTYNTNLIETYSYEFEEGNIFENLEENLKKNHVVLNPIIQTREDLKTNLVTKRKYPMIVILFCSFLNLMKSNLYNINGFDNIVANLKGKTRYELFLKLFTPIFESYEKFLKENDKIDFNDMIKLGAEFILENKFKHAYNFIIIDEFQDMSVGRFKLIEAMLFQRADVKLFCVGDDWQSIYRFTGTDISIITEFEKYFGFHKELKIENTYRFPDNVIKISSGMIMNNENQKNKELKSSRSDNSLPIVVRYYKLDTYETVLMNILKELQDGTKIFLIGRYNHEEPKFLRSLQNQFPNLNIDFITAHKSKGLEADNTILLNITDELLGFPCQLAEDPVLNLVLKNPIQTFEEERRLFYVALTRTKNKIYILNHTSKELSLFLKEIIQICNNNFSLTGEICRRCHSKILLRRKDEYSEFYGCSRYPVCQYNETVHINPLTNSRINDDDLPF